MAQTTRLASFGPVFVVAILPKPQRRVFCRFRAIYTIKHKFSINEARKKKNLLNGPNDAEHVVWARFCQPRLPWVFSYWNHMTKVCETFCKHRNNRQPPLFSFPRLPSSFPAIRLGSTHYLSPCRFSPTHDFPSVTHVMTTSSIIPLLYLSLPDNTTTMTW